MCERVSVSVVLRVSAFRGGHGLGIRVWGLGVRVYSARVYGLGLMAWGSGSMVRGLGIREQGPGFRDQGSEIRGRGVRDHASVFKSPPKTATVKTTIWCTSEVMDQGTRFGVRGAPRLRRCFS